ncbi:MAG: amidohydrolase [SAR324 cluster bacterium]|nr:amidohydrolase [SAR324 cluster bacterium]MCZ6841965.1 amidohydrolase [SAR324 cluster bacterium]
MPGKEELKAQVCAAIDQQRDEIIRIGETILNNPETGFREIKTAQLVASKMEELGLRPQTGLALTGVKGKAAGSKPGPTLALLGELDSLRVSDHPHADPDSGAAHACGHNAQVAGMLGAAMGLLSSGAMEHLAGSLAFFAVPAEELIEVEHRMQLKAENKIEFLTGKAELIRLGHFDDVQLAMMFHTKNDEVASHVADSSNGSVVKKIRFLGRAAHAGSAPQKGINALNAASLALTAIAYQRETFYDNDTIRIHPIITKGGDAVSVVPAEVCMETFIRGKTLEGIVDANRKVDNALRGAAMAIGAQVEIETTPGYLPQTNNPIMAELWGENVRQMYGEGQFHYGKEHRTGSTDMGDVGHIMPVVHPYLSGATGTGHGNDYILADHERVYVASAKLLAMTAIDLMYGDAEEAARVLKETRLKMTKEEYLQFQRALNSTEHFQAAAD